MATEFEGPRLPAVLPEPAPSPCLSFFFCKGEEMAAPPGKCELKQDSGCDLTCATWAVGHMGDVQEQNVELEAGGGRASACPGGGPGNRLRKLNWGGGKEGQSPWRVPRFSADLWPDGAGGVEGVNLGPIASCQAVPETRVRGWDQSPDGGGKVVAPWGCAETPSWDSPASRREGAEGYGDRRVCGANTSLWKAEAGA